jgi:hypothetical protein
MRPDNKAIYYSSKPDYHTVVQAQPGPFHTFTSTPAYVHDSKRAILTSQGFNIKHRHSKVFTPPTGYRSIFHGDTVFLRWRCSLTKDGGGRGREMRREGRKIISEGEHPLCEGDGAVVRVYLIFDCARGFGLDCSFSCPLLARGLFGGYIRIAKKLFVVLHQKSAIQNGNDRWWRHGDGGGDDEQQYNECTEDKQRTAVGRNAK